MWGSFCTKLAVQSTQTDLIGCFNSTGSLRSMQAYSTAASGPAVNLSVIDGVVATRKQLSQLLGAPSYAHYQVCPSQLLGKRGIVFCQVSSLPACTATLEHQHLVAHKRWSAYFARPDVDCALSATNVATSASMLATRAASACDSSLSTHHLDDASHFESGGAGTPGDCSRGT